MKYCQNCGAELPNGANNCPKCGQPVTDVQPISENAGATSTQPAHSDNGSFGWAVLGFFIPLVGLILFLVWKKTSRHNANSAGLGALVGFVFSIICWLSMIIVTALAR